MLTIDVGVMVAVSCCTALSFSTSDIASLRVCGPFSYMQVIRLWAFFKALMNILIVAASLVNLHLLASVLNQCTYAARESFSHCWISMNQEVTCGYLHYKASVLTDPLFHPMTYLKRWLL